FQLPAGGHHAISAFNFLIVYGPFISASCFVPLLCVWVLQRREKLLPKAVCEGLVLLALTAFIIPNTLVIISGSGWYFLDVARWAGVWAGLYWFSLSRYAAWQPEHWVGAMRGNVRKPHYFALLLLGMALADGVAAFKTSTLDEARRMASAEGYGAKLLSALSQEERRADVAVYVPRGSAYWAWPEKCEGTQGKYSATQGYFFQAMAGMPILNPYPYDESPCAFRYSEYVFGHEALRPPPEGETDAWLCATAQRAGFAQLLVLDGTAMQPEFRTLSCR
ncbi:MAG: hypothetical protein K2Q01_08820, partial [Rickettsiales bacterium]|nr:hypothetical protein [Rickettsiales bacterium]